MLKYLRKGVDDGGRHLLKRHRFLSVFRLILVFVIGASTITFTAMYSVSLNSLLRSGDLLLLNEAANDESSEHPSLSSFSFALPRNVGNRNYLPTQAVCSGAMTSRSQKRVATKGRLLAAR